MDASELARKRLAQSRAIRDSRLAANQRRQDKVKRNPRYQGFDVGSNRAIVEYFEGQRFTAVPITNAMLRPDDELRLRGNRVDTAPHYLAVTEEAGPSPIIKKFQFWLLLKDFILEVRVTNNKAQIVDLYSQYEDLEDLPSNFDREAFTESFDYSNGFCRISQNQIWMPVDSYQLVTDYPYATIALEDFGTSTASLPAIDDNDATFSCDSYKKNYFFFVYRYVVDEVLAGHKIVKLNKDSLLETKTIVSYDNQSDVIGSAIYSIAAINENNLILVRNIPAGGQVITFYNWEEETQETLFTIQGVEAADTPDNSLGIGSIINDYPILNIWHCCADQTKQVAYAFVDIRDSSGFDDFPNPSSYPVTIGMSGIATQDGVNYLVLAGDFSKVYPGDKISITYSFGASSIGDYATVVKWINPTSVWVDTFIDSAQITFVNSNATVIATERSVRVAVLKINKNKEVSLYFKFPGNETRTGNFEGYKAHIKYGAKGAVVDEKNQDIYLTLQRERVIKNGFFVGSVSEIDKHTLVRITKDKKLEKIKVSSIKSDSASTVETDWQGNISRTQLERRL